MTYGLLCLLALATLIALASGIEPVLMLSIAAAGPIAVLLAASIVANLLRRQAEGWGGLRRRHHDHLLPSAPRSPIAGARR